MTAKMTEEPRDSMTDLDLRRVPVSSPPISTTAVNTTVLRIRILWSRSSLPGFIEHPNLYSPDLSA